MHRRTLLKGLALGTLQWVVGPKLRASAREKKALLRRVRPGDPRWPSPAKWEKLKAEVGGNLVEVKPPFAACAKEPQGAACGEAMKNIQNPFFIGDQPGGTQVSGWLDAWTPQPSAYAVAAHEARHVAAAVDFARENDLRLVVKGGGHSYLGTSNAPDSLLVWTRQMNAVTLHDAFVPTNCEGRIAPVPAVSAGSGAMWIDLYDAVTTKAGRYVQGGGCTTVGVAGLVQSGGFGSCSKGFGTAASWLLEAEIVTADGKVRLANAGTNPDLFWALKGGGGGSWGVVTRVTLRTHDLPRDFGYAGGKIKAKSDAAFRALIARFVAFYRESLFNPHWGEQAKVGSDNVLDISMVSQGIDDAAAKALWQPFISWAKGSSDYTVDDLGAGSIESRHWWDVVARRKRGSTSMIPDARPGAPEAHAFWRGDQEQVGAFIHGYESMWLPQGLLAPGRQAELVDALFAASRHKEVGLHFNKGLAGAPAEALAAAKDTATNPAVLDAFALVIIADGEGPAYPGLARPAMDVDAARKDAGEIDRATAELAKIVPNAGSYVSESNFFNRSWPQAYWGTNHPKLQAVKKKYDPDGLFFVHHGVGSEEWSADGFERTAKG
ncbi:MAG TPA: FAD-binding oxidoreductase [Thermoanaerobaculia bacterium]|nr:FAD-binding oxidoreductase [Thermoanaerobaculia bacterium]